MLLPLPLKLGLNFNTPLNYGLSLNFESPLPSILPTPSLVIDFECSLTIYHFFYFLINRCI